MMHIELEYEKSMNDLELMDTNHHMLVNNVQQIFIKFQNEFCNKELGNKIILCSLIDLMAKSISCITTNQREFKIIWNIVNDQMISMFNVLAESKRDLH